jgi:hemerythrin-like metal-binding protein
MIHLRWTPEYAVGVNEIDLQHKELIDRIHALFAGMGKGNDDASQRALLDQLADYTRYHFGLEEGLMEQCAIAPEFKAHHYAQHKYFVGVLADFTKDYINGRRDLSIPFIEYLVHWILHHIMVVDRELAKQINQIVQPQPSDSLQQSITVLSDELSKSERYLLTDMHHMISELRTELTRCQAELNATKSRMAAIEQWIAACPERKVQSTFNAAA